MSKSWKQWTIEEEILLQRAADLYERQWTLIHAIEFPDRSRDAIAEKGKSLDGVNMHSHTIPTGKLRIETEPALVAGLILPYTRRSRLRTPACLVAVEATKIEDETNEQTGERTVTSERSPRVKSVQDLIREMNIDMTEWDIKSATAKKWEMGAAEKATNNNGRWERQKANIVVEPLYLVSVVLVPKNPLVRALNEFGERLCTKLAAQPSMVSPAIIRSVDRNEYLAEIAVVDHHFGKYARKRETGHGDWDLPIAEQYWRSSISLLLERTTRAFQPSRIMMPFGNDASHFDTKLAQTTAGTHMDAAGRYFEVYEAIVENHVWAIEQALQVAPVDMVWVPGNHDYLTSFHLAQLLKAKFERNPHVNINAEPTPRKYYEWGINLLGFTHGSEENMSQLGIHMAKEAKAMWARTSSWEWHIGHTHKMKILGESFSGVRVRVLPTLTSHDHWHNLKGYMDRRAAEAYVWGTEEGYASHFSFNVVGS